MKSTPRPLILAVERDSVCAGDDVDAPHAGRFAVGADASLAEVLVAIRHEGYLAGITGGLATWIVESDRPLAVVAQQWCSPRFLVDPSARVADYVPLDGSRPLFFHYWCQADPAAVFDCLKAGTPLPDRYGRAG